MTDEWPSYHSGRRDHLQALGVIALSYSAFQRNLQGLYAHHPLQQNMPHELVDLYFTSLSELNQIKAIRTIFDTYENDPATLDLVNNLIEYFNWSAKARNELLHSELYPPLLGGDADNIYLIKRKSKKEPEHSYQLFTIKELRDIADQIEEGKRQCAGIIIWLRLRDIPIDQLPLTYRALKDELTIKPLTIPPALKPSPHPQHGAMPDHLKNRKRP